jgi:GAF domain-containing protein
MRYLDLIVNEAARLLGASGSFIRLLQGDGLVPAAATKSVYGYLSAGSLVLDVTEGVSNAGHVMATKKPVVSEDSTVSELSTPEVRDRLRKAGFHARVTVPMLANDQSIGVLSVMDKRIRRFTEDEVSLLSAFADQASLALEKSRLLNEAEARERQATQLYEVTTQLASNHDLDSVLDLIAARAVELLGCEASAIFEYDPVRDGLTAARTFNFPPELAESLFFKPGEATTGMAFQQRKPVWTRDRFSDPLIKISNPESEAAVRNAGVGAAAAVPIIIRDQPYGVLNILFYEPHDFTDGEIQLLQTLADSAAVAIGNAQFIEQTQQARDEAEVREQDATQLQEVTAQLASSTDMDSVLDLIVQKTRELLSSDASSLFSFDWEKGGLVLAREHKFLTDKDDADAYVLPAWRRDRGKGIP